MQNRIIKHFFQMLPDVQDMLYTGSIQKLKAMERNIAVDDQTYDDLMAGKLAINMDGSLVKIGNDDMTFADYLDRRALEYLFKGDDPFFMLSRVSHAFDIAMAMDYYQDPYKVMVVRHDQFITAVMTNEALEVIDAPSQYGVDSQTYTVVPKTFSEVMIEACEYHGIGDVASTPETMLLSLNRVLDFDHRHRVTAGKVIENLSFFADLQGEVAKAQAKALEYAGVDEGYNPEAVVSRSLLYPAIEYKLAPHYPVGADGVKLD